MIDTSNLNTINANIEAVIDKNMSKLSLGAGSSNVLFAHVKFVEQLTTKHRVVQMQPDQKKSNYNWK